MTTYLDGDRLRSWLEDQRETLLQFARERHDADGSDDPTALRMDGGVANMTVILNQLHGFEVTPNRTSTGSSSRRRSHRDDPDTSHEAALRDAQDNEVKRLILAHLARFASHPDLRSRTAPGMQRILSAQGMSFSDELIVARRLSDLKNAGLVEDSGDRVINSKGSKISVWQLVQHD